ncbi:MAG TPA: hypothetical protein VKY27_01270 [Bacteriovoracaceae bacterium]|nr:hypothetical protein [Bacteriovoracaceae bacterium]
MMRWILALLTTLFVSSSFAFVVKVDDWRKNRDMDRSIVLFTQSVSEKVTLDCQSFIQGMWFGEFEEASVVLMDPNHCMQLFDRIKNSVKRGSSHCIEIEDEVKKDYRCR